MTQTRRLEQQRDRREKTRRIDYYPSRDAERFIDDALRKGSARSLTEAVDFLICEDRTLPE
jgi:hypothetical protein